MLLREFEKKNETELRVEKKRRWWWGGGGNERAFSKRNCLFSFFGQKLSLSSPSLSLFASKSKALKKEKLSVNFLLLVFFVL